MVRALLPTPPAKEVSHESLLLSQKKTLTNFLGSYQFHVIFDKTYLQLRPTCIQSYLGICGNFYEIYGRSFDPE